MLFNSHEFIFLFLPLVLLGYWGVARLRNNTLNVLWLLTASLVFYGLWKWQFLFVLGLSTSLNYAFGTLLCRAKSKRILACAIVVNVAALFYYKYFNLFKEITDIGTMYEIILPLGISFFTFTQIAYLVDCYKGKVKTNSFTDYALFVTYFPHLIAGPILHHKNMISQFRDQKIIQFNSHNFAIGTTIFIMGLFKKVMLADGIMPFCEPVFGSSQSLTFLDAWGGACAYSLQLYFDFSGYSDMAIGISKMFNIDLPINFDSPYKAKSLIDFWKRWHISLSSFLKDYIYIPLGGSRKGIRIKYINIFLVMCISGIWHGAACTFFVWGLIHATALLINHGFRHVRESFSFNKTTSYLLSNTLGRCLTMGVIIIGWVFFRSPSISFALSMTKNMLILPSGSTLSFAPLLFPVIGWYWVACLGGIVFFLPNTNEFMGIDADIEKRDAENEQLTQYQQAA